MNAAFSAATVTDDATGWAIVVLRYERGGRRLQARLAPAAGGNLFSLVVGRDGRDEELLHQPDTLAELAQHRSGTPVLFPTPNRVRDARMTFGGRSFAFEPNSQANFIHGLVRDLRWQVARPRAGAASASVGLRVDWNDSQPQYARFPIRHRLSVTYTLRSNGVRIGYAVENQDAEPLPFGFGLHPFFRAPARRRDALLVVPATHYMEAEAMLPTGRLLPVAGTRFDLRKPTPLEGLTLDDAYTRLIPGRAPGFVRRDLGLRVTLAASAAFTHAVVYTPPQHPFFCIENQTSSTDAHNLWARGFKKESHLLVVAPGKIARGAAAWTVSAVRPVRRA
jgi:aldose 1-epimerase